MIAATPKRPAAIVKADFEDTLRQASANRWAPNCHKRPAEFMDYEEPPAEEEADALCDGCPMRALCGEFAATTKPGWGVWAGQVWEYGRIVRIPSANLAA